MADTSIILHIGRHKSGTSGLQHYLTTKADELAKASIIYPQTGRDGKFAHHDLAVLCCKPPSEAAPIAQETAEALFREIAPFDRAIISSEAFQNVKDLTTVRRIFYGKKRRLGITKPTSQIKVICYLREYLEYAASSYCQSVQNTGLAVSFNHYLKQMFKVDLGRFSEFWHGFSNDLSLLPFSRQKLFHNDIIDDFCQKCELPRLPLETSGDQNPSISGNLLAFKLILNSLGLHNRQMYRAFTQLANNHSNFRGKFLVTDEQAEKFRTSNPQYNRDFTTLVGEPVLSSFAKGNLICDEGTWNNDLDILFADPVLKQSLTSAHRRAFDINLGRKFAILG